jgi:hypothetical protein
MKRLGLCAALAALAFVLPASAQTQAPPPGQIATPSDYILLTVIMRHHQTMNLGEISKILEEQGFSTKFPPEGIQVESWYAAMGLGHVVTLRVGRAGRVESLPHRDLHDLRFQGDRQDAARAGAEEVVRFAATRRASPSSSSQYTGRTSPHEGRRTACRASSFQAPPSLVQICKTWTLDTPGLPSASYSKSRL